MDDKFVELANVMRASHTEESSLTIRWAVVLSVVVAVLAFLFGGFISNAMRLTKIETTIASDKQYQAEVINNLRENDKNMLTLLQSIRDDQIRREHKEAKQ